MVFAQSDHFTIIINTLSDHTDNSSREKGFCHVQINIVHRCFLFYIVFILLLSFFFFLSASKLSPPFSYFIVSEKTEKYSVPGKIFNRMYISSGEMHTNSRKNLQKQEEKRREDESDQRQSEHQFGEAPYLISSACVAGSKEAEGPLGKLFDMVNQDDLFGAKTWEEAESTMQKEACVLALGKAHVDAKHVRYLYGGDLLRQGIATSMGVEEVTDSHVRIVRSLFYIRRSTCSFCYERGSRVWGIYAGSDFQSLWKRGKGISVSAGVCVPASLICQLDGDGKRRISGRQTEKHVRITGVTVGKIVDYGLKDSQNMGACMAPAAADTILTNLKDFGRSRPAMTGSLQEISGISDRVFYWIL